VKPKQANCPVCSREQPGQHKLACHFTGMSRDRMITAFIPPVRLSPDGTYYICSRCSVDWKPGITPACNDCSEMWELIDANKGRNP